jgi:hypothetical protein
MNENASAKVGKMLAGRFGKRDNKLVESLHK